MKLTDEDYQEAKALLDGLNARIAAAPLTAKPVFRGIVWLHEMVASYEREQQSRA